MEIFLPANDNRDNLGHVSRRAPYGKKNNKKIQEDNHVLMRYLSAESYLVWGTPLNSPQCVHPRKAEGDINQDAWCRKDEQKCHPQQEAGTGSSCHVLRTTLRGQPQIMGARDLIQIPRASPERDGFTIKWITFCSASSFFSSGKWYCLLRGSL